jgi:prepilin-type processing-associated H-X9-DG protein
VTLLGHHGLMLAGGGGAPAIPSPFFSSDPMLSTSWSPVGFPSGLYDPIANRTYVCWQFVGLAGYKGVHIAYYDHATGAWSERYTVGNFLLANDDHGMASLLHDDEGYFHCYYGSHNNGQKYSVSNSPDDISAWTQRPDIGSALTYPKPVLVGSTIYLFVRDVTTFQRYKLALSTMTPTAGIGTHSALTMLVDFGADSRCYTTEPHLVGTDIHFCCTYTNADDVERHHVYYMVLDTTTGDISNFDGSVTVASGSLPITLAQANTSFKIFDHGSNDGDIASLQFDTNGDANVLFADGTTPTYDLKHMVLSGGSWSSPVTIASISDQSAGTGYVDTYSLTPGASGKMEAWYNNSAGDKMRRIRSAAGTWAAAETIKAAGAFGFIHSAAIKSANANLRTIFSEKSGTTTDSSAVALGLYAYGDSGPVNATIDMTALDPAGFDNVTMLLNCNHRDGVTTVIDDSKSSVRMAFSGNAQIDTAQSPFAGKASILLDGAADIVTALNNAAYSAAGTGNFAIDAWVRLNETGRLQTIMAKRLASNGSGEFSLFVSAGNVPQFIMWNGTTAVLNLIGATVMTTGVWYFVEASRIAGVTYLFLGALGGSSTLQASGTQSAAPSTNTQPMLIGRDPNNTARDWNGWLFEPRFTQGVGRHSSGYTAPTGPAPRR